MLIQLIRFECYFYTRQLSYGLSALCFLALGFLLPFGGYGGNLVQVNAPFAVSVMMSMLSLTVLFVITLFSGNGLARDLEYRMTEVVYSTALSKAYYFVARFSGLYLSILSILFFGIVGMLLGALFVETGKAGPFVLFNYAGPFLGIIVPNLLFSVSLMFAAAVITQRTAYIYVTGLFLFVFYLLGSILGNSPLLANASPNTPQHQFLAILLDPFGLAGVFGQTRHWSVVERNSLFIPMQEAFLLNRFLWPSVGIGIIALVYRLFSFRISIDKQKPVKSRHAQANVLHYEPVAVSVQSFTYHWVSCWAMVRLEIAAIFKQIIFWAFLALWVVYLSVEVSDHLFSGMLGIASYPTTGAILELLIPEKLAVLLLIFYSGEIIWSDRSARIDQIKDATPLSSVSIYVSKLAAVVLLIVVLLSVSIITVVLIQASHHYYDFQPRLYLSLFYYSGIPLFIYGALLILVQTLVNNKFLGMLIGAILLGASLFGARYGLEHPLLRFGHFPDMLHSDINGFANGEAAFKWLLVYWLALAGIFLVYGAGNWKRGMSPFGGAKLLTLGRGNLKVGAFFLLMFLTSGAFILYQLYAVGNYRSAAEQMDWQAAYEKQYKPYSTLEQPTITKVQTWVDLNPRDRWYRVKGTYQVKNTTSAEMTKLLISLHPEVNTAQVTVEGYHLQRYDKAFGQYWFVADDPFKPGDEVTVRFNLTVQNGAFMQFNKENSIVSNGSYIELEKILPSFGYNLGYELTDKKERERRGLPTRNGWPEVQKASLEKYSKVTYETVISINDDQQPISVGKLVKKWNANGRRYFQFKAEEPVPFMFAIAAAGYSIRTDHYKDVAIEFYYHEGHEYNISTMMESVKHSLQYMEEHIGPYPFTHLRVVEIPHYPGMATAYPGVIFVRESSYLQDFRNPEDLNYAYSIAHEVAHQWWGNIVEPANMQGYKFLTETMAQYLEHAILEEKWGKERVAHYLKNQQDVYLINRGYAKKTELPLLKTEDDHYIHYQKGAVVMNGIKELIGEKSLNEALKNFYTKYSACTNRPTSLQFLDELHAIADSSHHALLDFWLSKVYLYDLGIDGASYVKAKNGHYEVKISFSVSKQLIHDDGQEEHVSFDETLQLAVYDEYGELLLLDSILMEDKNPLKVFYVNKKPGKVILDPYITRLDMHPEDNIFLLQ